jgi:HAD superfamily hydrolase (TIGR01509 family)
MQRPRLHARGVIFDMDGTLADSIGHYYGLACQIAELAEVPPASRERVCELMGTGDPDLLRKLLPSDFPDFEQVLGRIVRELLPGWRKAAETIDPLPGCVDLLHELHARGQRLGIATSSGRALPYLDRWGVRHVFHTVVGREDHRERKPHPEVVLRCLDGLGIGADEAIYVGDSPIDIEAGRRAGVCTVGVLTGTSRCDVLAAASADHILDSATELLALLES